MGFLLFAALAAAAPATHRLDATPQTVVWGYYDSAAKPVLRVNSGDTVVVRTLITSTPERLEKAGVAPEDIEPALREIVKTVVKGPAATFSPGPSSSKVPNPVMRSRCTSTKSNWRSRMRTTPSVRCAASCRRIFLIRGSASFRSIGARWWRTSHRGSTCRCAPSSGASASRHPRRWGASTAHRPGYTRETSTIRS